MEKLEQLPLRERFSWADFCKLAPSFRLLSPNLEQACPLQSWLQGTGACLILSLAFLHFFSSFKGHKNANSCVHSWLLPRSLLSNSCFYPTSFLLKYVREQEAIRAI